MSDAGSVGDGSYRDPFAEPDLKRSRSDDAPVPADQNTLNEANIANISNNDEGNSGDGEGNSCEEDGNRDRKNGDNENNDGDGESSSDLKGDAGEVGAFRAALQAHLADGLTMAAAVSEIFSGGLGGGDSDDKPQPRSAKALQKLNLAGPILTAIASEPDLGADVLEVARLCAAMYQLAEEDIHDAVVGTVRERLDLGITELDDVARIVDRASNIVVLSGAGVSVSCGIPDFRSKGGLYDTVLERYGLSDPQAIFDLDEFKQDPTLFFSFAKDIMPSRAIQPSATHFFIAELDKRGKLLRNYSQNIDGLEHRAGISPERVVLCHGSFLTATCMRRTCKAQVPGTDISHDVKAGIVPKCRVCGDLNEGGKTKKRKAISDEDDDDDDFEPGGEHSSVLKPDIVFFGENLPKSVATSLQNDVSLADLVLVLGTSLQVAPVARIPQQFADSVPRILVNRELVGYKFDVELLGDCDGVVGELGRSLGWKLHADSIAVGGAQPSASAVVVTAGAATMPTGDATAFGATLLAVNDGTAVTEADHIASAQPNDIQKSGADDVNAAVGSVAYAFYAPRRFTFPGAVGSDDSSDSSDSDSDEVDGKRQSGHGDGSDGGGDEGLSLVLPSNGGDGSMLGACVGEGDGFGFGTDLLCGDDQGSHKGVS
jgi:NAD-dependent SIR2 family protein deacetylase